MVIGYMLGLYRDNGKENGNYYRVLFEVLVLVQLGRFFLSRCVPGTPSILNKFTLRGPERLTPSQVQIVQGLGSTPLAQGI